MTHKAKDKKPPVSKKAGRESAPETVEIYVLADPRDYVVRYVGKANDAAARLVTHMRDSATRARRRPVLDWVRKLQSEGVTPKSVVILTCPHSDWQAHERRIIAEMRAAGIPLLNVADGGDAIPCTREVRSANGRKAANRKGDIVFWLMCELGRQAKWSRQHGDQEVADGLKTRQAVLRSMSAERRAIFAANWKASGNYYPGRAADRAAASAQAA